jgi:hypothetical protein
MFKPFDDERKFDQLGQFDEFDDERKFDQLGQFDEFDADFAMAKITLTHIYLNVYLNAQGTVFANDSKGNPIQNRLVYFTSYTLPYEDPVTNSQLPGYLKVIFNDGSYIKSFDDAETTYWYSINGLEPFEIKQFT